MTTASSAPASAASGPRPICFMVMPFRRRKVESAAGKEAPAELDCDALWDRAIRPALEDLGYLAIRADADTGSVIVQDMLDRLAYADLVLADVSLPNGNVYYELGLRHVARTTGCITIAADWSSQLFDIGQIRTLRYSLRDGLVPEQEAEAIRRTLTQAIPGLTEQVTPWHVLVSTDADVSRQRAFRHQSEAINSLQARIGAARLTVGLEDRAAAAQAVIHGLPASTLTIPSLACELLQLVRDSLDWDDLVDFLGTLPHSIRRQPYVREQELLALAEVGQPEEAIARLEQLVSEEGDSPERQGLIGGRYKRLWREARKERQQRGATRPDIEERRHLEKAIEHYSRGMEIDLNQYYCSCNLPALLIERDRSGDRERAQMVEHLVLAACDRALKRGVQDEYLRPTLLGAAFRSRDIARAAEIADLIELEGSSVWKLEALLADLETAVQQARGHDAHEELQEIHRRLLVLAEPR
jgi:tetratricopeptide (TPR) repeat protein